MTGSALCAASPSLRLLALSRVVQGAGGSMLLPVGRLAVLREVPRAQFLQAMSLVSTPGLIGPLVGPTIGGWLSEYSSWHWIFIINIPVGIIGAIVTTRAMPQLRNPERPPFDLTGYLMIAAAMVAISLALDGLSELNLPHSIVLILFVFGLATLSAYWLHAAQSAQPLFSPQLFRVPTYSIGLLGNLFARIGSGSVPYLLPLTLQIGLGYSPAQAGLMMIPTAAAAMVTKQLAPPLIKRLGYRLVLMANTIVVGMFIASFAWIDPGEPLWLRVVQFGLMGAANSLQFTAMNTLTLKDLSVERASSGNSLLSAVQMVSMSFGVAASAALLATYTELLGPASSTHLLRAFHLTFISVGLITTAAAWIFSQLSRDVRGSGEHERPLDVAAQ